MSPPAQTPSLQTIADLAGVSRAAVSLALRNQSGISSETRDRIQKIAADLGYRPNAMVSALMAHLKGVQPSQNLASIPFLTSHSTPSQWRQYSTFVRYFQGAESRADQMGYRLDEIWMREPGVTAKKLHSILINRGIQGLLIGPRPEGMGHISLNLSTFAVATVGHSVVRPRIHRAVCHQIESLRTALHHMRYWGYRRIALAISKMQDRRNEFNWSTAYAGYQLTRPVKDRLPIFYLDEADSTRFSKWLDRWKPDAILSGNDAILESLSALGLSAPNDIGVATLDRSPDEVGLAGIDQQFEVAGAAAIDMIVSQVNRNEHGIPASPKIVLTQGLWITGNSLRKVARGPGPTNTRY